MISLLLIFFKKKYLYCTVKSNIILLNLFKKHNNIIVVNLYCIVESNVFLLNLFKKHNNIIIVSFFKKKHLYCIVKNSIVLLNTAVADLICKIFVCKDQNDFLIN